MEDRKRAQYAPPEATTDATSAENRTTLEEKRLLARRRFLAGVAGPVIGTVTAKRAFAASQLVCGSVDSVFFFDNPFVQGLIDLFGGDPDNIPLSCFCGKLEPGDIIPGSSDFIECLEQSQQPPSP